MRPGRPGVNEKATADTEQTASGGLAFWEDYRAETSPLQSSMIVAGESCWDTSNRATPLMMRIDTHATPFRRGGAYFFHKASIVC